MPLVSRPFDPATDLHHVVDFLVTANRLHPRAGYLQLGDLLWRLYQNTVFDPVRHVHLWEDPDGTLLGFAWHEAPDGIIMQVHPELRGGGRLELAMLAWGAAQVDATSSAYDGYLRTRLEDANPAMIASLTTLGFARDDRYLNIMWCSLDDAAIPAQVPPGFKIRAVGSEAEWAARVALHQVVWHPSAVTLAAYERLRQVAWYRPDLDLVVVAPDGTLAAYGICWLDAVNHSGEFEPVGTSPAFRGRGLGKAVIGEGLRRLRAQGAREAYVAAEGDNEAARALYESVGFTTYTREYAYKRPL